MGSNPTLSAIPRFTACEYSGAMDLVKRAINIAPAVAATCEHLPAAIAEPRSMTCEGCGSNYNLRLCTTCGHVGCCESQAGHAAAHAKGEDHPVIMSMPVGRGFTWCYPERRYL